MEEIPTEIFVNEVDGTDLNQAGKCPNGTLRISTRLQNKQKVKPDDNALIDIDCRCGTCESCATRQTSSSVSGPEVLLATKRPRDFWSVQEQNDFFDGLKLYGKEIHSIFVHMKSVAKRRARLLPSSSSDANDENPILKVKTKEQIRHFYYRKLQLCQRLTGNSPTILPSQPRDIREVYLLLCYDSLKKIFRDKLDPRLARPDFALHFNQMVTRGCTVVKVGRKGRFRAKPPNCAALRSWNNLPNTDGRGSGSGDVADRELGACSLTENIPLANLPSCFTVELLPANNYSWSLVHSVAHNPRLAITAAASTKLEELRRMLEEKWRPRFGPLDAFHDQLIPKFEISFLLPNLPSSRPISQQASVPDDHTNHLVHGGKMDAPTQAPKYLLQMSLVEIFLLVRQSSSDSEGVIRLEYLINAQTLPENNDAPKSTVNPALSKLLYFASLRLKMLKQYQQHQRIMSPSSKIPRLEDNASQNVVPNIIIDVMPKPANATTPRRRATNRKSVNIGSSQQPPQTFMAPPPPMPSTSATAANFIEQLKELRGKTQRKNRLNNMLNLNVRTSGEGPSTDYMFISEEHQPKVVQPRRLMPKPVPLSVNEGPTEFQTAIQNSALSTSNLNMQNDDLFVHQAEPSSNMIITPVNQAPVGTNYHSMLEVSNQSFPLHVANQPSGYISNFHDASLDISLPSDSNLAELLKPPISNLQPNDHQRTAATSTVLDLCNMSIVSSRPISPNAGAAFDMSFGDPSLGGLLSSSDMASASSLTTNNKSSAMNPWLMQDSSLGLFDEASFLLPTNNANPGHNSSQQPTR